MTAMNTAKFDHVYSFRTDKDHRRLCLADFSYLLYWQCRHEKAIRSAAQKIEQPSVALSRFEEHKKEAIGFGLFFTVIVVLSAICATVFAWLMS